ncbi:MAG: barstar family protein [Anaerolineaceae bacterium]|nr:barstar family protein [Anaerolineaceae bacterium]
MDQIIDFISDTNSEAVMNIEINIKEITEIVELMQSKAFIVRIIKLNESKAKLFDSFAHAFDFPYYFNNNWDSLVDCLTNEDMKVAEGYLVIIEKSQLLIDNDEKTMLKVFHQICSRWKEIGIQFKFLIVDTD